MGFKSGFQEYAHALLARIRGLQSLRAGSAWGLHVLGLANSSVGLDSQPLLRTLWLLTNGVGRPKLRVAALLDIGRPCIFVGSQKQPVHGVLTDPSGPSMKTLAFDVSAKMMMFALSLRL